MHKKFRKSWVLVALGGSALWTAAAVADQSLDLGLSNHVFVAGYGYEFRPDVSVTAGFLHSNLDNHKSDLLSVGLSVAGNFSTMVKPRIGAKLFLLDGLRVDGHGLAAEAGATITVMPRLLVDVSAAYSPDIVTSGDVDNYYDIALKVGYEIIPNGQVYVGFQDANAVRTGKDYEIYQGIVAGFRMKF